MEAAALFKKILGTDASEGQAGAGFIGSGVSHGDVGQEGSLEQKDILGDHGKEGAEGFGGIGAHVFSKDADLTGQGFIKAQKQLGHSAFSCTSCSDKSEFFAAFCRKGHVAEYGNAWLVPKFDAGEGECFPVRLGFGGGLRCCLDVVLGGGFDLFLIEKLEDALGPGQGALEHGVALGEHADWLEELAEVLGEGDDGGKGQRGAPELLDADPKQNAGDAKGRDHFNGCIEGGFKENGALVGIAELTVDGVKLAGHLVLSSEGLDDGNAADLLGQKGVEAGGFGADVAVGAFSAAPNPSDQDRDDREGSKSDEGKLPIEQKHGDDDTDEHEEIANGVEDTKCKEFGDGIDVIDASGGEASDGGLVVIAHGKGLEERENVSAQVGHGQRARKLHAVDLAKGDDLGEDGDAGEDCAVSEEEVGGFSSGVFDDLTHQKGAKQVDSSDGQEAQKGEDDIASVGCDERPQTGQEFEVVAFVDGVLVVKCGEFGFGCAFLGSGFGAHDDRPSLREPGRVLERSNAPRASISEAMRCSSAKVAYRPPRERSSL